MKVCLVLFEFKTFNRAWTQILRNLGIDYTLCTATSAGASANIQTPQGVFSASSSDLRNYFRQFDAVILCDNRADLTVSSLINYSVFWLSWNAPEDPPFLFFNPHFSTAITESAYNSNFPSDFPIVRPNPSDIAGTLYAADGGSATAGNPLGQFDRRARGACVLFVAENIRAHVQTICNTHTNYIPYYWRLDTTKHSTLANTNYTHRAARNGRAGEILAVPAPPTSSEDAETYPNDCVVAYRYRNIFWLPHAMGRYQRAVNICDMLPQPFVFWLLYGLQLAGVRPRYKLPVQIETDHPLEALDSSASPPYTLKQQCDFLLASWDWMRDFARRKNTAIVSGVRVGGRERNASARQHWAILYNTAYPAEARDAAMQVHQILLAGHREGATPCGPHDHTIGNGDGLWGSATTTRFVRHSGTRYGAPNNVPITRGRCCVAPHVLPSGVAPSTALTVEIGDTQIVEWDHTTSGTGNTFDLPMDNIHAARMIVEGHIDEMLALGFPDGYCGGHKYTNTAGNNSGGECYWQALKEFGFRGVRSSDSCTGINIKRVAPNRLWHGFHLVGRRPMDNCSSGALFSRGLYLPSAPSGGDAVGTYLLDHGSDISTNWTTQQAAAWRAYRRLLCQVTGIWLHATAVELSGAYWHPNQSLMCVSLTDVVAPFDGWSRLGTYNT
ncbi:MAG: hypothetical protein K6U77_13040, partial [Armatimonadetes bacterium]|nr:hypothetical protein [Armatimonadota bacterium]